MTGVIDADTKLPQIVQVLGAEASVHVVVIAESPVRRPRASSWIENATTRGSVGVWTNPCPLLHVWRKDPQICRNVRSTDSKVKMVASYPVWRQQDRQRRGQRGQIDPETSLQPTAA